MNIVRRILTEYRVFKQQEANMRILLLTNMCYALVLPVVEIFVGAYIMRNTGDAVMVTYYQLMMYAGIVVTSFVNGFLLERFRIKSLYAAGILVSGVSMFGMMSIPALGFSGLGIAGFTLGAASGFFWTNRYLLALNHTRDENRNYFFGLESFFFSIASIGVPLIIGACIVRIEGKMLWGIPVDLRAAYRIVTAVAVAISILACVILWKGNFENPGEKLRLYFRSHVLWRKMLLLSALKGMVQGFLVTAPAVLVLHLVGNEEILGLIQGISGAITAVLVYILGRTAGADDRLKIFLGGMVVFFVGTLCNGILFSATGVILFILCKVIFQPLFDLAYFPIMMRTIDVVVSLEKRNKYTYILSHELGLFLGRASGLLLFIVLAGGISQVFALKYALPIVGGLQLLSWPLSKNITNQTIRIEQEKRTFN
ncbi:MAG: MFS transporter [Tannerellaceae bacterium]|nr:MFS transporter [Tannerellaceae bacterium]